MKDFTEQQVVFLLSMPRSGSTLLSLMLGSHSAISAPPEPWIVLAVAEFFGIGGLRDLPYDRKWAEIAAVEFLLRPERRERGALAALCFEFGQAGDASLQGKAKRFLDLAYRSQIEGTGKQLLVDKTPRYYAALDVIDQFYPNAKKVVLLRNPLDIFASYKSTWHVSRDIFKPEAVTVHCRDFIDGLFAIDDYRRRRPEQCEVVHYEDLSADPERSLRRICKSLDVPFSEKMLSFHENIELVDEYRKSPVGDLVVASAPEPANSRSANAWERRLELEDVEALISVLGADIFESLGYSGVLSRLKELGVRLPSEGEALERRETLRSALRALGGEPPYSTWDAFWAPLRAAQSSNDVLGKKIVECESVCNSKDEVIRAQRGEIECAFRQLEACEKDRAARLAVIQGQQEDLDRLGFELEEAIATRSEHIRVIDDLHSAAERLSLQLEECDADRAARLAVIHGQQEDLDRLGCELHEAREARSAQLTMMEDLHSAADRLRLQLEECEADSARRLAVIQKQQDDLKRLGMELIEARSDRDTHLNAIDHVRAELERTTQQLMERETENELLLKAEESQRTKLCQLEDELGKCNAARREGLVLINELRGTIGEMRTLRGFVRSRLNRNSP